MRYNDDRYHGEDYDELWNDELDINTDLPADDAQDYYTHSSESDHPAWNQVADDYNADSQDMDYSDEDDSYAEDSDTDYSNAGDSEAEDYYASEPQSTKPKREGFFRSKPTDREEENDFFTSDAEPEVVKKTKTPTLDPEDPDYWLEEESELENIIHKTKNKWKWWLGSILAVLFLILVAWIWFFRPYVDDAVKYGYIKNMERRGSIVKTFEGSMIPYKELGDPNPMYFEEIRFSVESDSLAAKMKRMMLGCVPVRVEYELYHSSLPWKGDEKMIITKVDSADVNKILPPDYRYYK